MDSREPTIEWDDEPPGEADPLAEQKAYFAKHELLRQQRIREQRENTAGMSIYEQSQQRPVR